MQHKDSTAGAEILDVQTGNDETPSRSRMITRRLFLRSSAAAGAAAAVAVPVAAAEPVMTTRELAIWHMRELERLAIEDGARSAMVTLVGRFYDPDFDCRTFMIDVRGEFIDFDAKEGRPALFAPKGGEA
ncbi:MAG: twin-arginine translocation signal domain-containing protein [Rhizobiaceae bacterium]